MDVPVLIRECRLGDPILRHLTKGKVYLLPGGFSWDAVDYPRPFALALALTKHGTVVVVEQWRFPAERRMLVMCGGGPDKDEAPEQTAARELLEESGYKAGPMELLMEDAALHPAANTGRTSIYVARDCECVQEPALDPVEKIAGLRTREFTVDQLREIIACGDRSLDLTLLAAVAILLARYSTDFAIR